MQIALIPEAEDVGCFYPHAITLGETFGWETLATFLLVVTIYSVAVGEPSFGVAAPLAIGLALFAASVTSKCEQLLIECQQVTAVEYSA